MEEGNKTGAYKADGEDGRCGTALEKDRRHDSGDNTVQGSLDGELEILTDAETGKMSLNRPVELHHAVEEEDDARYKE